VFALIVRLCAALMVFAAASTASAALAAPSPAPIVSATPCASAAAAPGAASLVIAAAADKKGAEPSSPQGNAYTVASTAIWAIMWIIIMLIAQRTIVAVAEAARPTKF
jgi:hypothetical protein